MLKKREIFVYLKKRDGLVCGLCGLSLEEEWNKYQDWIKNKKTRVMKRKACNIDIDHIVPASVIRQKEGFVYKYGWKWEDLTNLQLTHSTCNVKKGNAH